MPGVNRILVGTDFSPTSQRAIELAADVARSFDAELVLLHVDDAPETAPLPTTALERREHARAELDRSCQALKGNGGVNVQVLMRPGDPAREILRVAAAMDVHVIVVGTHGATAPPTLLLGSVADRVVRYAALPVLVVPHPRGRDGTIPPPSVQERRPLTI